MRVMVVGSGCREHALIDALQRSPHSPELFAASGNAGIALSGAEIVPIAVKDINGLARFAKQRKIGLTVVGPEDPLAVGIVDVFQNKDLQIWGPAQKPAQLEADKIFAKQFMRRNRVPTSSFSVFETLAQARSFARLHEGFSAIKLPRLAQGKGVGISKSSTEALHIANELVARARAAGHPNPERLLFEEYLEGRELSVQAFSDGQTLRIMPYSCDYKRLHGKMTGGMGAYSPVPWLSALSVRQIEQLVIARTLQGLRAENLGYPGVLYPGLMMTKRGPQVLEYNVRFGSPEVFVMLARMQSHLLDVLIASVTGRLADLEIIWKPEAAVCVMLASTGYPSSVPETWEPIRGLEDAQQVPGISIHHGDTVLRDGVFYAKSGTRVLAVTALAATLQEARQRVYEAVRRIHFDGIQYREDIAEGL